MTPRLLFILLHAYSYCYGSGALRSLGGSLTSFFSSVANTTVTIADFNTTYDGIVDRARSQVYYFNYSRHSNETDAFRVSVVSMDAREEYPILITVKQQKGVLSWQIPLFLERLYPFLKTSRTLCPTINYRTPDPPEVVPVPDPSSLSDRLIYQDLYIELASSAPKGTNYTLKVRQIPDFFVELNRPVTFNVTPSEPQYVEFRFPPGIDRVLVHMTSNETEKYCGSFSIQPAMCPVADLESDQILGGVYQSVTSRGSIVVTRGEFSRFYVVVTVKAVDIFCQDIERIIPTSNQSLPHERKKIVEILITETLSTKGYIIAISACVGFFAGFYLITCLLICGNIVKIKYCLPTKKAEEETTPSEVGSRSEILDTLERDVEGNPIPGPDTSSPRKRSDTVTSNASGTIRKRPSDASLDDEVDFLDDAEGDKNIIRLKPDVRVEDLTKKTSKRLAKKDRQYRWSMMTICIFYGLPVLQLVITYQRVLRNTGNQDICFYNFSCANPLGILSDFNHVISNIGYVLLGLLFILLVRRRQLWTIKYEKHLEPDEIPKGIPNQFELFYAMGLALMMEGLMSGSYHICPSYSNFQFDTSFMYLIAGLGMLKVYQSRHADILPNAYISYAFFAFIILIAVLGVVNISIYVWIAFSIALIIVSVVLSTDIYFLGLWQLNLGIFRRIYVRTRMDGCCSWPLYMDRFVLLLFIIGINWTIAIMGPLWQPLDFASYVLAAFVANFVMYVLFYMLMKIRSGERISRLTILFIVISGLSWGGSLYLFTRNSVNWQLTPSRSREVNEKCVLLDFYDYHDLWHLCSSVSLFFSFMILLTLDDDLVHVPRTEIAVF